jgi:SAM-dependent methyltransferase
VIGRLFSFSKIRIKNLLRKFVIYNENYITIEYVGVDAHLHQPLATLPLATSLNISKEYMMMMLSIGCVLLFVSSSLWGIVGGNTLPNHRNIHHVQWTSPVLLQPNAKYYCTCSRVAVAATDMLAGPHKVFDENNNPIPRACRMDGSLERHRYMCAYFHQHELMRYLLHSAQSGRSAKSGRAVRVLHNAPEASVAKGLHLFNNTRIDYVGFDFAVGPLPYNDGFNEFKMDVCNLSFPDNYFDMIITSHVLEHVPDLQRCTKELYRVMRPGAVGFIAIPFVENLKTTREKVPGKEYTEEELQTEFGQKDHVRLIGNDFVDLLKRIGFYVDPATPKQFYQKHFPEGPTRFRNAEYLKTYDEKGIFFVVKDTPSMNMRPRHLKVASS